MPLLAPKVRSDLKYQPDPAEEGRYFVKDPIRGEFFRYNELQVAMMRALDGKRSVADVQAQLAAEFDVEVPAPAVERFIDRLERSYLLDVSSYRVDDAKTRRAILAFLQKRKLALRVKARDDTSPEAALFEAATRHLNHGDPCMAASYLEAVLEVNPHNQRARQVLQCIQEAFFKTKIEIPSHVKMVHLWDPDRFLAAIDRRAGRFLFGNLGIALMVLYMLAAAFSALDVMERPELFAKLGVVDVVLALLVFALHVTVHELAHGLACKHYGGTVDSLGLLLMYGVLPGGYCDVSESYLFANRWHKIRVQLAGVFGHMVLQATAWHLLYLTDASFPLWTPLLAINLFVLYSNVKNLIPLAKFDGYYALAELLGIVNLRERSFAHLKERVSRFVLGIGEDGPEVTPRERTIFLVYGVLACAFTAGLLYFLFISFLLPLAVETLGTAGLVLSVLYIAQQILFPIVRASIRLGVVVVRQRATVFTRARCIGFAVAAVALVVVLALPWPLHVEGAMVLEPRERAHVRAVEPGLVIELRVREGDRVEAGQLLAVLRADELERDHAFVVHELAAARAQLAILRRGARDEELAIANADTRVQEARVGVATTRMRDMHRRQHVGAVSMAHTLATAAQAYRAGGELRVSREERALVRAGARVEDIASQEATVRQLEALHQALALRIARLEIKSPISGVVVSPRPEEQLGRWLVTGGELLEIHDISGWRVRITPDRGEPLRALEKGQDVEVRVWGEPTSLVVARLDAIAPPEDEEDPQVVLYASSSHPTWRSGMTGLARIHVPSRSIGYRVVALPLIRIFDYDLWRMR
jgi:putative peptide zinc metalloprotease protein